MFATKAYPISYKYQIWDKGFCNSQKYEIKCKLHEFAINNKHKNNMHKQNLLTDIKSNSELLKYAR